MNDILVPEFNKIRLLSLDPGTNTLGMSISEIDITTSKMVVLDSYTVNVPRVSSIYCETLENNHDEKVAKLEAIAYAVFNYARAWEIEDVASEAPYMGKFPAAYAALVSCINSIRAGCLRYNSNIYLNVIDPARVKKTLGVPGNSGNKDLVSKAILSNKDIDISRIDFKSLDEHSIDSIAVGYAYLKLYLMG